MTLISFDENNKEHLRAFNYFAYDAGHPEYLVNDIISDFDFDFREILSTKFNLNECFVEEPNGCEHEFVSRILDKVSFKAYYGTDNDQNGYDEVGFSFDGTLLYNTETKNVVLEPSFDSIIIITEVS